MHIRSQWPDSCSILRTIRNSLISDLVCVASSFPLYQYITFATLYACIFRFKRLRTVAFLISKYIYRTHRSSYHRLLKKQ